MEHQGRRDINSGQSERSKIAAIDWSIKFDRKKPRTSKRSKREIKRKKFGSFVNVNPI